MPPDPQPIPEPVTDPDAVIPYPPDDTHPQDEP